MGAWYVYVFVSNDGKTVNTLAMAAYPTASLSSLIHGRMWILSRVMTYFRITSLYIQVDHYYRIAPMKQPHLGIGGHTISPMEKCIRPKCSISRMSRTDTMNSWQQMRIWSHTSKTMARVGDWGHWPYLSIRALSRTDLCLQYRSIWASFFICRTVWPMLGSQRPPDGNGKRMIFIVGNGATRKDVKVVLDSSMLTNEDWSVYLHHLSTNNNISGNIN